MKHFNPIELKEADAEPTAIVQKALDDLTKSVGDRLAALETKGIDPKLIERLDRIEAKANRLSAGGGDADKEGAAQELKAWLTYLRKGPQCDDISLKALTIANDTAAGYLAPAETSAEFVRDLVQVSPIRQYASVRNSSAPSVKYPRRTGITNAKWEGEIEESDASEPTFGQLEITSRRLATYVDISNSLLMGSDGAAEAEVRLALSEDFGQKEGAAFVSGNGVTEPEGILTASGVGSVANGSTSALSTDSLIGLMYSLPALYRNRGVWLLNGTTLAAIRKLKDGQNNYLWQPSFQAGQPETILGRPVVEAVDMPDISSGATPIVFGDLGTAYRIVDRQQLATLADPYTQAAKGITRIHATRWVGAGVIQAAALKKLKMSNS